MQLNRYIYNEVTRYELYQDIAKYYPIGEGNTIWRERYVGLNLWREVTARKLDTLDNPDIPWRIMINQLKSFDACFEQADFGHEQFPSYSLRAEISKTTNELSETIQTFCLDISLLTKKYTTYLEVKTMYPSLKRYSNPSPPPTSFIITTQSAFTPKYDTLKSEIDRQVATHYAEYNFIDHMGLFNIEVQGTLPYNLEPPFDNPTNRVFIYDLLFSYNYTYRRDSEPMLIIL